MLGSHCVCFYLPGLACSRRERLSLNIDLGMGFLVFLGKTRSSDGMDCRYRLVCVLCSARSRMHGTAPEERTGRLGL